METSLSSDERPLELTTHSINDYELNEKEIKYIAYKTVNAEKLVIKVRLPLFQLFSQRKEQREPPSHQLVSLSRRKAFLAEKRVLLLSGRHILYFREKKKGRLVMIGFTRLLHSMSIHWLLSKDKSCFKGFKLRFLKKSKEFHYTKEGTHEVVYNFLRNQIMFTHLDMFYQKVA